MHLNLKFHWTEPHESFFALPARATGESQSPTYCTVARKLNKRSTIHWGYLQMKPETLIFWDPVFGAWLWATWAPLMPSKLNLAALTRSILTIKFRNPTQPPQIIKPSSKKPVKCVKASVPLTITHLHGCSLTDKPTSTTPSSTPHSQLSPFYSRFSVPLQIFTITRIQNPKQIAKIQKCEAAIPTIWNKNNTILSTLHLCTLQIFTITETQKID